MHPITRKLFLYQIVLLAGCSSSKTVEAASFNGKVSLAYIARLYSMRMSMFGKKVIMQNKYNKLEVETNSRYAWINGIKFWLHEPCRKNGNNWAIREADFKRGIDPIMRSYAYVPKRVPKTIVLDPGHGGKDVGAPGPDKLYEKNVVLDISHRVRKHLESKKFKVRMTRTGDSFPQLDQRTDFARSVRADLFISIHADGAGSPAANGVETFITTVENFDSTNHYGQPGDKWAFPNNTFDGPNAILGFSIQSNLVKKSGRSDRGVRRARFSVIKKAPCPAALVECGFLSNPAEGALLASASYREKVAQGITNGILGYYTLTKRARK